MAILAEAYGPANAAIWNQSWRIFWMSCTALFGYDGGGEWLVGHYRFAKS
jgi:cyclopropane-fatty-acyl-phospholipid synthase